MTDKELEETLNDWKVDIPDDPGFQRAVWHQIELSGELLSFSFVLHSALERLMRPAVGIPVAAAVILLSAWMAVENGKQSRDATWKQLASSYQQTINPLGAHR